MDNTYIESGAAFNLGAEYLEEYVDYDKLINSMSESSKLFLENNQQANFRSFIKRNSGNFNLSLLYKDFIFPLLSKKQVNYREMERILFRNIKNKMLKNIFLDRAVDLNNYPMDNFDKAVKEINETYNVSTMDSALLDLINNSTNGYSKIIETRSPDVNKIVFPVIDYYDETLNIMFSMTSEDSGNRYVSVGICEINTTNNQIILRVRNHKGLNNQFNANPIMVKSVDSNYKEGDRIPRMSLLFLHDWFIKDILQNRFNIQLEKHDIDAEKSSMFEMNRDLVDHVLKTPKEYLLKKTKQKSIIKDQVVETLQKIRTLKLNDVSRTDVEDKIFDIYLAKLILEKYTNTTLRNRAQESGAFGYPTSINFSGTENAKSKVRASGIRSPLVRDELYFDIQQSLVKSRQLGDWRIAWFKSYLYNDSTLPASDLVQTSIHVKNDHFWITFLPKKLDSQMIDMVLKKIGEYLEGSRQVINHDSI